MTATTDAHRTERALCRQVDPDAFFATDRDGIRDAKAVCAACGVRTACLADALERGDEHAILGGTTPRQRDRMRRSKR